MKTANPARIAIALLSFSNIGAAQISTSTVSSPNAISSSSPSSADPSSTTPTFTNGFTKSYPAIVTDLITSVNVPKIAITGFKTFCSTIPITTSSLTSVSPYIRPQPLDSSGRFSKTSVIPFIAFSNFCAANLDTHALCLKTGDVFYGCDNHNTPPNAEYCDPEKYRDPHVKRPTECKWYCYEPPLWTLLTWIVDAQPCGYMGANDNGEWKAQLPLCLQWYGAAKRCLLEQECQFWDVRDYLKVFYMHWAE